METIPMGARRYHLEIPAPLAPRFKVRLERSVTLALFNARRASPGLRRIVIAVTRHLRSEGFDDDHIRAVLGRLVEDIAHNHALDATSLVTGQPRWMDLKGKMCEWVSVTAGVAD